MILHRGLTGLGLEK